MAEALPPQGQEVTQAQAPTRQQRDTRHYSLPSVVSRRYNGEKIHPQAGEVLVWTQNIYEGLSEYPPDEDPFF